MRSTSFGTVWEWFGLSTAIPDGFILADGSNGTPDLKDKFIIGAGDTYPVDELGGSVTHTQDFTSNLHFHFFEGGDDIALGNNFVDETSLEVVTGTTDASNGLPPFLSLLYLMKL